MKRLTPRQIELRAIKVLERLARGETWEDSLVELKQQIDAEHKVARRIAAHCNASRGDTVLWIIGADEKRGVVGWNAPDFAQFLPKIWDFFDGGYPECIEVTFEYNDVTCTALAFEADRTPYLVKNPNFGAEKGGIEREIPWREGTRVRTAKRDEVIRLLLDRSLAPDVEFFRGQVCESEVVNASDSPKIGIVQLRIYIEFYAMPRDAQPVIIPIHRISARLSDHSTEFSEDRVGSFVFWSEEGQIRNARRVAHQVKTGGPAFPSPPPDDSVKYTGSEVIISRPAHVHMSAEIQIPESTWKAWDEYKFEITMLVGPDQIPLSFSADLTKEKNS